MVPLRLAMRNFLCYRDNCPPLDLSQINMACLSGENGHGKSALLDAITWAVWGGARARSDDELIHLGRVDMEVEFDFRVGDVVYRVLRKRRKGTVNSPGRTMLEFQVLSGEVWKALSGATVRDTQARIIEAVRLDYDTFRNSAFLVQGRADEFTLKAPGERKRVLGEILGLGVYDAYELKAREERKRCEAEARLLDAALAQYAAELAREPQYERDRRETREELSGVEAELAERKEALQRLQEVDHRVKLLRSQLELAERDRVQAADRVARARDERGRQQAIVDRYQALLDQGDEIRARFAALGAARAAESEQSRRLSLVAELQRKEAAAQKEIQREEALLQGELGGLVAKVERLRSQAERRAQLQPERVEAERERVEVERDERRLLNLRQELQERTNTAGQLQAANKRLRDDMDALKRRQSELREGGALCPVCRTELGEDGKRRLNETYEREGHEVAEQYRENRKRSEAAEARGATLDAEIKRLDGALGRRRGAFERRIAGLDRDEGEASRAAVELTPKCQELERLQTALAGGQYADEARRRLAVVRRDTAAAGYDQAAYDQARTATQRLGPAESEYTDLQRAEEAAGAARAALVRVGQEIEEWSESLTRAEARTQVLRDELDGQQDPHEELIRLGGEIGTLEARLGRLQQVVGAAEQKLEDCRRFRRLHEARSAALTQTRREQQIYDDLVTAFGRKGVQALIIDAVIPEIEEEANRLLSRMSNGTMTVTLDTQREKQKGGATETLDIRIADELGTRSYEMFSGGEAFRINLALRIALSKLLARRAGAPLPTLIVDEGFGTQDAAGRERLLEAMNAVSRDFECLIVITHIDELKDQFDRQIRVEKRPEGSFAWVE